MLPGNQVQVMAPPPDKVAVFPEHTDVDEEIAITDKGELVEEGIAIVEENEQFDASLRVNE